MKQKKNNFKLIDLRENYDEKLLNLLYRKLYLPNFPIPEEREDPKVWKPLLQKSKNPLLHILVAKPIDKIRSSPKIIGFIFAEFYKKSKCGLLTYLAVHLKYRRQEIGKYLLKEGVKKLKKDAKNLKIKIKVIFGEINDPQKVKTIQDSMNPKRRLEIIAKLGAHIVPIRYIQPQLKSGQGRFDKIFLIVFPLYKGQQKYISGNTVIAFLYELYKNQGVKNVKNDEDLMNMTLNIKNKNLKLKKI